jgi:hypothetical protein
VVSSAPRSHASADPPRGGHLFRRRHAAHRRALEVEPVVELRPDSPQIWKMKRYWAAAVVGIRS